MKVKLSKSDLIKLIERRARNARQAKMEELEKEIATIKLTKKEVAKLPFKWEVMCRPPGYQSTDFQFTISCNLRLEASDLSGLPKTAREKLERLKGLESQRNKLIYNHTHHDDALQALVESSSDGRDILKQTMEIADGILKKLLEG